MAEPVDETTPTHQTLSNRFVAAFNGTCTVCGDSVLDGDEAGYVEDGVACDECCDLYDAEVEANKT